MVWTYTMNPGSEMGRHFKSLEIVFCFTFFQLQLRETVEKPNFAKILRFLVENAKLPLNWVFQLFPATVTGKK